MLTAPRQLDPFVFNNDSLSKYWPRQLDPLVLCLKLNYLLTHH